MLCPLKLILIPVLLDYSQSLNDFIGPSPELRVRVGDSALLGCTFQNMEERRVIKVDWILSPGNEYVLYYYANHSVPMRRFQNRVRLVGDLLHNDGSLLIQNVQKTDQGNYTCEIRHEGESKVLKKSLVLHVLPEEPKELTVHVGHSIMLECVFHSTEEKQVTTVDWRFSSGESAKEEIIFCYDFKSNMVRGYLQNQGRFRNRVDLLGDISHNNGSIMLHTMKESDQGGYTCSIHLENLVFRKTFVVHVIQEKNSERKIPEPFRPQVLSGNQVVIIVGIVCSTLVLLPVLILIVKRTSCNNSSINPTAMVKSLENTKVNPEKHVYSAITTWDVTGEEPRGPSEAAYMTMHPVRPSLKLDSNTPPEKPPVWGIPQTEKTEKKGEGTSS